MRNFSARETEWLEELDGIQLASFWQRFFAFLIDWMIVGLLFSVLATLIGVGVLVSMHRQGKSIEDMAHMLSVSGDSEKANITIRSNSKATTYELDEHSTAGEAIKIVAGVLVPVLYFGILLWKGKGRTPGKRLMRIRVVSIVHRHLSLWHSVERALGYGAAALEGGFGFVQFFIHPYRRCAQDRLAETMVVTESGYQAMQQKSEHPLLPDTRRNRNAPE